MYLNCSIRIRRLQKDLESLKKELLDTPDPEELKVNSTVICLISLLNKISSYFKHFFYYVYANCFIICFLSLPLRVSYENWKVITLQ